MKKYFVFIVLTCLLGNRALAQNGFYTTETIDFTVYHTGTGNPGHSLSFDNDHHPRIDNQVVSERLTVGTNEDWGFWSSNAYQVSYLQKNTNNNTTYAYLSDLKAGDVVTIWGEIGNDEGTLRGAFDISGGVTATPLNTTFHTYNGKTFPDSKEYRIESNGTATIKFDGNYSGIRKITITSRVSHFDYDPGYEEYDLYDDFSQNDPKKYNIVNGQPQSLNPPQYHTSYTLSTEETGITLNNQVAQYIVLSGSKNTANNRIAIDPSAGTWCFNYGLRAPKNGKWANFSICNLKEGDRVVFSYTGTAPVFSSVAGGADAPTGPYNGSKAFADQYNDGVFDAGEDVYITSGTTPVTGWQRGEGAIYMEDHEGQQGDYDLKYSRSYVITEDGHLDIAIAPDTRIVKIKIYSDHQATMIDEYDADSYTAKFDITGELQAMEHIVPGGLEVHVGSDDASQHAHVVSSAQGPVSIVNGVNGFKLPGMYLDEYGNLKFHFNLNEYIPTTGTFYKFMPLEDGKINLTFQTASMNYYTYGLNGDAVYYGDVSNYDDGNWQEQFDRPNEQTVDATCPYYLVKVWKDNNNVEHTTFTKIGDYGNGTYPPAYTINDAKAGDIYYLYGGWNGDVSQLSYTSSGRGNNNLEYFPYGTGNGGVRQSDGSILAPACGVAKLLEVVFNPKKKIYPLAKWVPNNTLAVNDDNSVPNPDTFAPEFELAELWGYNDKTPITVKMMTGNITACNPYLQKVKGTGAGHENHYRLMIDGIQYGDGDKGGTILIKIGDATVKNNPVYTLTIAYSTDPTYDGNSGTGTRGHIWDYSSKSLHGLKYEPVLLGHKNKQGELVNSQQPQPSHDIPVYTSNVAVPDDYGHYFTDYFAADISNYSSKDDVLSSNDQNLQESGSGLLYEEIHGGNSDWMFNYNLVNGGNLFDPVFTNKYAMEYDNADMILETEGTVIKAGANASVMFNEYHGDINRTVNNGVAVQKYDPDRFVGITNGSEFRIPWLRKNDRVIIYMGTGKSAFSEQATFSIKNAYDAEHNIILPTDDYVVGGSHWDGEKGDPNYRGCYHFFAQGGPTVDGKTLPADMVFKMTGGSLCKIYSIQIYRGDRIITNEVVGATANDKFLLWSRAADPNDPSDEAEIGSTYNWTLKHFGKDQKLADGTNGVNNGIVVYNEIPIKTGAGINDNGFSTSIETDPQKPTYNTFTYTHDYGQIGTFRMRGKDMEKKMKYVADYADHNVTIAYQQTQPYPYTWDFMDMTGWGNNVSNFSTENAIGIGSSFTSNKLEWFDSDPLWNASYEKSSTDLSLWGAAAGNASGYALRLSSQESPDDYPQDNIFESAQDINGNQLWANGSIIPESQGLWYHTPDQITLNSSMRVYNDGMSVGGNPIWQYNMVVPNVPAGAVVYMRIKKAQNYFVHKYKFAGSAQASDITLIPVDPTATVPTEWVASIKNNSSEKKHLTLSFVGYTLEKLAVSLDPKSIGKTGFATESRARIIDHDLTEYFTLAPVKAYQASFDDDSKPTKVILSQIRFMPAAPDLKKDNQGNVTDDGLTNNAGLGCILYHDVEANTDEAIGKSVTGGFHLFVPDMHDNKNELSNWNELVCNTSTNILRSCVPAATEATDRLAATDGTDTRYILSAKPYQNAGEGYQANDGGKAGLVGFYKVDPINGAKKTGNIAYMQLSDSQINNSKISLLFFDELFGEISNGIATGISEVNEENASNGKAEWYSLDGQKLNGVPTAKGLYIVNGKKVLVK